MWPLLIQIIKKRKNTILIFLLISVAFNWMYVAFFPELPNQAEDLTKAFASYPEAFIKALGIDFNTLFTSLEGFLAAENFSLMWPIITVVLVVNLGSSAIAGEIEKGTIEILLAQPLSRAKIFWAKYLSGFIITILFTVISVFSIIPFAKMLNVNYRVDHFYTITFLCLLFALALFAISIMFSSLSSSSSISSSFSAGLIFIMYAVNIFSAFKDSISGIKYISLFHYYDFNQALLENSISILSVFVFLAVIFICTGIGFVYFLKRDITT